MTFESKSTEMKGVKAHINTGTSSKRSTKDRGKKDITMSIPS